MGIVIGIGQTFQFTHPGRGATARRWLSNCGYPVSIHAPREGCDGNSEAIARLSSSFNSRTPGGVRRFGRAHYVSADSFNSRTPGGVRQAPEFGRRRRRKFQFTHPGRGATTRSRLHWRILTSFNSRTPGGVRPEHTDSRSLGEMFQFTHPGRGATRTFSFTDLIRLVSIHAPREGCDLLRCENPAVEVSFNSRTPGGVRPFSLMRFPPMKRFQFTHPGRGATIYG